MYRNGHFNTKLKILKVLGHGNEDLSRGKVKIIIESVGLVDFREECAGAGFLRYSERDEEAKTGGKVGSPVPEAVLG